MNRYKIGYTTGVFDMFHIGHLNILKAAKARCDYLIVGVSTDELVKDYKKKTPIIKFEERIAIVQAISYVDQVVPQTTMDKVVAWEQLKFNAVFHGEDWKNSSIYDKYIKQFDKLGVDMVFLPYTDGISSSILADVLYKEKEKYGL